MNKRQKVKFRIEYETEFESYESEAMNQRAIECIREQLEEIMDNAEFLDLYVEKNVWGEYIDDATRMAQIKIERVE